MPDLNIVTPETIVKSVTIQDQLDTIIGLLNKSDYTTALLALVGGFIGALIIGGVTWYTSRMTIKEDNKRRLRKENQEELEKKQMAFSEVVSLGITLREVTKQQLKLQDNIYLEAFYEREKTIPKGMSDRRYRFMMQKNALDLNDRMFDTGKQFHQAAETLLILDPDTNLKNILRKLMYPIELKENDSRCDPTPEAVMSHMEEIDKKIDNYIEAEFKKPMEELITYYRKKLQKEAKELQKPSTN